MKHIYVLPTQKPSRLIIYSILLNEFRLVADPNLDWKHKRHIYITSDEEIKEGDWCIYNNKVFKIGRGDNELFHLSKKIILTTDPELINDGVQAIDDEFLEWFVKNPSCERVVVNQEFNPKNIEETLEEAAENFSKNHSIYDSAKDDTEYGFINGAKWQQEQYTIEEQHVGHTIDELDKEYIKGFNEGSAYYIERMYSEEDMAESFMACWTANVPEGFECKLSFKEWFEQFKKK